MEAIEGESKEETAAESTERKGTSRRLIKRKRLISSAVPDKKQQLLLRRRSSSCGAASDESHHQMAFGSPSSKSSGRGFSSTRKRKRGRRRILIHPVELEDVVKPELDADQEFDAAQALFQLLGAGASVSNPATKPAAAAASAMMLHWTGKKTRSNRSSTKASPSLTTSITVSCQILPPPPASSLDLFSSSSRAAAAPVEVEVVEHEMIFDSRVKQEEEEEEGCEMSDAKSSGIVDVVGVDVEQQQVKLVSESSLESMQLDSSRAVSPSSPLPELFRADVTKNIVRPTVTTTTSTTTTTTQSAFALVMPMLPQPLKKLSVFQKPKIEDELPESYIMPVMKDEWKQGTRGRIPSWISSETGSQVMASSKKVEGFGIQQGPAVFLNEFSNGRNNIVKSGEGNHLKLLHSVMRLKEEENKVDSCSSGLNMEEVIRQKRQKRSAASTQGRTALSEVEREARRLRRIQANRESARQTIRRKQVLCEELGQKAAALVAEKEDLQQKVERQTAEYRLLLEMNMRLKEQVAFQADNKELTRASSAKLSSSAVPVMPMSPLLGLRLPPFCWALALAQGAAAGQASIEQAVGRTLGLQQQNPMLLAAAAMAATATFNNGIRLPSLWMGKGGENIASTSSLVPKPATESVVDNQQSLTTTSVSVPSIPPALSDVLPEKNCVSFAGERNKNLETVQIMREGQFLAPKVEEVAVKSGASNVKSQQRQSSGPPVESSPLLSLVQPSLTAARPSASLQSNHHVLGIPYVNKEINPIMFSSYRNGRQAGFMGGGAIYGTMPINSGGTTVAAAAAEARRRRIEELKRSRTLQRSRSAPSRSAPRLTVSTLAL